MKENRIKQLLYEISTWKRSLSYILEENLNLKNRLAEVLKNGLDKTLRGQADYFQKKLITEDNQIGLIQNYIDEIDEALTKEELEKDHELKTTQKINGLRDSVRNIEKHFSEVKSEFNNYLFETFFKNN